MIQICRAEDGETFQVNATLRDIERRGSLEGFLHQETGVDQDAILAYLSDGTRLRSENVRELVGAHDQTIFVFNKYYLDFDLNDVLNELRVEPLLQPPIEDNISATPPFRPSQLATSYLHNAHAHIEHITHVISTLHRQHQAIQIASSSLDLNVLAITDVFDGMAGAAGKDLERQAALLAGLDADLEIIARVRIHVEFMSPAVRKAIENGERHRTLGDYVSNVKMKQVAETCARTHEDLRSHFGEAEASVTRLTRGTNLVRGTVTNTKILEDAEASGQRSQEAFERTSEITASLEAPRSDSDTLLQELKQLDLVLRYEVEVASNAKNAYIEQCIGVLRQISALNIDLVQLPTTLSILQTKFRSKNSFSHIQRLHQMLYAYGATVIEIVRRKEFARFFYQRAQGILEVMAKLSASERKRRQMYRGDVHGQLPFDTKGMDDSVPVIDFSPSGSKDSSYSLEREDVDVLLRILDDLEAYARASTDPAALGSVQESRIALERQVQKMDTLESGFDRIAERSLLSASRLSTSRRRLTEADEHAFQELAQQLRDTQEAKLAQENLMQEERSALQAEIHRLNNDLQSAELSINAERERADSLERDLHQARAQAESEVAARRILERRNTDLSLDVENERQERARALADATEQTKIADLLRQELAQVRSQAEEVKAWEEQNAAKVALLLEEQATTLRNLEEARLRGEDLEAQIKTARSESEEVNRMLKATDTEKDRLLRQQATEHDRIMRDHIAEADGDRAVLEHQFFELRAQFETTDRQLKDARAQTELTNADAMGLREELQRVEHELREARHVERVLRDDLTAGRASQSDFEQRLESSGRLVAQMLDVAIAFRNSHFKALSMVQVATSHPNTSSKQSVTQNMSDSAFSASFRQSHGIIGQADEPSPIDPSDHSAALETLRAFDHDNFLEVIAKAGSVIRKWQKQCKEYRERAKGKISFRNFAKGDLALFLPTRNSISKPWAAFNVSFPHYFLLATGHLAEQLKTREWIVARITSITERVVDHNDSSSNPYGLGDGIKYYMLEVEDWTQSGQANKRRTGPRKVSALSDPGSGNEAKAVPVVPEPPSVLPPPPQAEVEDSFTVTHPPTSHLFPARPRANSTPTAGPSSLSRLLAQANPESNLETIPPSRGESPPPPTTMVPPPPSPKLQSSPIPHNHVPNVSSPLRPGSRASRGSTSSRFSSGRLPPLGTNSTSPAVVKAVATTAVAEHSLPSNPPLVKDAGSSGGPPSPSGSISEGMSSIFLNRRRTTSYHVPRSSPLSSGDSGTIPTASSTLASFASSWGVPFGRRRKVGVPDSGDTLPSSDDAPGNSELSAREMLKRF
ncbi:putative peripheral membrane protein [Hygrophoropsis aurantiaca]|uniref:Peripheral membrane protein n=1 Tax=Hygrophoropsis aurantiaca TaxID=72124 RepID=A0ACB8AH25_9AGAM|nr:putative peripheral membrane protein [Hygrophoropsis aurantiaca]